MNKFAIIILFIIFFSSNSLAESIKSKDLVDLNPEHWSYQATINAIDKYKIFKCFPDHTFRGNKHISLNEFSLVILNFLKFYEEEKGISLKNNIKYDFKESFFEKYNKQKETNDLNDLKDNYGILIGFFDEKVFEPDREIDNYDVILAVDKIINTISKGIDNKKNNPFFKKEENIVQKVDIIGKKDFPEKLLNKILKTEIVHQDSIDSNDSVTRYRLSVIFEKLYDYLDIYEKSKQ